MDTLTLSFSILAACLVGVTVHAWRLGHERRDITLLGVCGGLLGTAAAVSAAF